jgi:hypothetical protein
VIDDSLRENALYSEILSPGADERARDAAKKLYRILKALEDRDGLLNLEELDETTIGSLKAKELIRTATKPINPKAVTLTLEVPLTCYHYTIGFLIILIACGLCLACCILGIILVWRSRGSGDEIVLTQGALVIRTTATGQRTQVSFPWESVKVTENECSSSPNTMTIASGDRTFQFSANEIAGYDRLRAALISRVGITIWITTYTTTYS